MMLRELATAKRALSVGLFVLLVQLFLYINADWVFTVYAPTVKNVIVLYFITYTVVLVTYQAKPPTLSQDMSGLYNFIVMFAGTALVMAFVPSAVTGALASFELVKIALGFALLWGFVKAYVEEIVFRHVLPKVARLGDIASSLLFGAFHAAVLTANAQGMVAAGVLPASGALSFVLFGAGTLAVLGYIWAKVRDTGFGLMGAVGSHTAYNLAVLGALPAIFGGA